MSAYDLPGTSSAGSPKAHRPGVPCSSRFPLRFSRKTREAGGERRAVTGLGSCRYACLGWLPSQDPLHSFSPLKAQLLLRPAH